MKKTFYSVELLRFLTALCIIIFHYQHFFYPYFTLSEINIVDNRELQPFYNFLSRIYTNGFHAVPMFWTISGFVFAHVYLNNTKISGKEFFVNRFARLYPLHCFTLILVTVLQLINTYYFNKYEIYEINDLYHFFLHLFFISGWGFENGYSFNNPVWSVSVELVIYLFFFITLKCIKNYNLKFLIVLSIILYLLDSYIESYFIKCARLFFLGVIVYKFSKFNIKKKKTIFVINSILLLITFNSGLITYFYPTLIYFFLLFEKFFLNKNKFFSFLGNQTYSSYLMHVSVQLFIIIMFKFLKLDYEIFLKKEIFLIYILLIFLISHYTFKYLELPLKNKIKKLL